MKNMKRVRAVAIVTHDNKLLLICRINNGKEYFVFPGGGVENGESVEDAVIREVKEETSLEVNIERLVYKINYDDNTEHHFYLCSYISGEPALGDANERRDHSKENFYKSKWYQIEKLPAMLIYPLEIRDWLTKDIKSNFYNTPREVSIKISERREI